MADGGVTGRTKLFCPVEAARGGLPGPMGVRHVGSRKIVCYLLCIFMRLVIVMFCLSSEEKGKNEQILSPGEAEHRHRCWKVSVLPFFLIASQPWLSSLSLSLSSSSSFLFHCRRRAFSIYDQINLLDKVAEDTGRIRFTGLVFGYIILIDLISPSFAILCLLSQIWLCYTMSSRK